MTTPFNFSILGKFGTDMYKTLLYKHHLVTQTPKMVEFKETGDEQKGYVLVKDNTRYVLPHVDEAGKDSIHLLPIRVLKSIELTTTTKDVVRLITVPRSFRIVPQQIYTFRQMVNLDGIKHSNLLDWTLWKIVVLTARLARVNVRMSACKRYGKTSYVEVVNYLLDKARVINRPRTIPGVCVHITSDGLICLDEMGEISSDIRHEMQNILFQYGNFGNTLTLGSAGSAAHHTRPVYDITNCSCLVLFNRVEDYKDRDHFFDYMFSNSQAINDRFLPLRPADGYLDMDQFEGAQTMELTEDIKKMFIAFMKSAEYYTENWRGLVDHAKVKETVAMFEDLKGRHKISFMTIASFIWVYSEGDFEDYMVMLERLHSWYENYQKSVKKVEEDEEFKGFKTSY